MVKRNTKDWSSTERNNSSSSGEDKDKEEEANGSKKMRQSKCYATLNSRRTTVAKRAAILSSSRETQSKGSTMESLDESAPLAKSGAVVNLKKDEESKEEKYEHYKTFGPVKLTASDIKFIEEREGPKLREAMKSLVGQRRTSQRKEDVQNRLYLQVSKHIRLLCECSFICDLTPNVLDYTEHQS